MPYKIVLHAPHGVLDQVTVKDDRKLKATLHKQIDEWELADEDSITIFAVTANEVETDEMFDRIITEIRRGRK